MKIKVLPLAQTHVLDSCLLPNQRRFRVAGLEDLAKAFGKIFYVLEMTVLEAHGLEFQNAVKLGP